MRRPRVPTRRRARCPPSSFPAPGSVRSGFPGFPCDTSAWISNVHGRCPVPPNPSLFRTNGRAGMHASDIDGFAAPWDELADFRQPVRRHARSQAVAPAPFFDSQDALWSVVVRLPTPPEGGLLNGWRLRRGARTSFAVHAGAGHGLRRQGRRLGDRLGDRRGASRRPARRGLLHHYLDVGHAGQSSVRWAINDYAVSGHSMFGVRNRSA